MIDNTNVVTYFSANAPREDLQWTAYVVLSNGEYWGVRFSSSNEEAVIAKAVSFYNSERSKFSYSSPSSFKPAPKSKEVDPWASVSEVNLRPSNWTWMRHKETRKLIKVVLSEIVMYEKNGYERSSPRSK